MAKHRSDEPKGGPAGGKSNRGKPDKDGWFPGRDAEDKPPRKAGGGDDRPVGRGAGRKRS